MGVAVTVTKSKKSINPLLMKYVLKEKQEGKFKARKGEKVMRQRQELKSIYDSIPESMQLL